MVDCTLPRAVLLNLLYGLGNFCKIWSPCNSTHSMKNGSIYI